MHEGNSDPRPPVERVAVVGCGAMGTGLVEACARAGLATVAIKLTPGDLALARRSIDDRLNALVTRGKLDPSARDAIAGRIEITRDVARLSDADVVLECAAESLAEKRALFERIERSARPEAILATNTSSLSPAEIGAALARPQRFLALHFFNPPQVMKLCEVAPIAATEDSAVDRAIAFVRSIGKAPVLVRDRPGYIVNRLLVPYLLQAIELVEEDGAALDSIDTAMGLGCGYPMGPLALADLIGLDVVLAMARALFDAYEDPRFHAPTTLRRLVLQGHLGKKAGRGFYLHTGDTRAPNPMAMGPMGWAGPSRT